MGEHVNTRVWGDSCVALAGSRWTPMEKFVCEYKKSLAEPDFLEMHILCH